MAKKPNRPEVPPEPSPKELELYKAELQVWVEQNRIFLQDEFRRRWLQTEQATGIGGQWTMQLSLAGIRTLIIANGGAALAILTIIGNSIGRADRGLIHAVSRPVEVLIGGLAAALLTVMAAYLTNIAILERPHGMAVPTYATVGRWVAIGSAFASALCFLVGSGWAAEALLALP